MKNKIISLLMGTLLVSGVAFAGYSDPTFSANKLNNKQDAQKVGYREILLVRNSNIGNSSITINSGDAVVWDTVSKDGASIRLTTTSADGAFAGIACTSIPSADAGSTAFSDDLGRNNWGYVIVYGLADANVTAGGTNGNAVGDVVITSTDSGKITTIKSTGNFTGIEGYNVTRGKGGFYLTAADGTSTNVRVFVKAK